MSTSEHVLPGTYKYRLSLDFPKILHPVHGTPMHCDYSGEITLNRDVSSSALRTFLVNEVASPDHLGERVQVTHFELDPIGQEGASNA